jgi:hypothetical protein
MKKIGIIVLSAAFFVLVVVSISSNTGNSKVNQRTVERMSTRVNPPVAPAPMEAGQEAPRLNPPHGQPGHICEIPVGAPLPTTSGSTQSATATPSPSAPATPAASNQPSAAPVAATSAQQSPRLNPPHGQPGHICEIPVGAPLPN